MCDFRKRNIPEERRSDFYNLYHILVRKYKDIKTPTAVRQLITVFLNSYPLSDGIDDFTLDRSGSFPPHLSPLSHSYSMFLKVHFGPHDFYRIRSND